MAIAGIKVDLTPRSAVRGTYAVGGHVLRCVDLEIKQGSAVCISGASGSGKSTLLRLLAGVLAPTAGRIEINGSVSSLIDVGDNLEPSLSARENIERMRRFRRLPPAGAEDYARDVIAFAGLEGFEDLALERYSSGMRLRLSFALALSGKPDILLIDDVLGVGDLAFQQQCVEALAALREAGSTLIMVMHDRELTMRLADRIITLADGAIASDTSACSHLAVPTETSMADLKWRIADLLPENDLVALRQVSVDGSKLFCDGAIELTVTCEMKRAPQRCRPVLDVMRGNLQIFRSLPSAYEDVANKGQRVYRVRLPVGLLSAGRYFVGVSIVSLVGREVHSLKSRELIMLEVAREGNDHGRAQLVVPFRWETRTLSGGDTVLARSATRGSTAPSGATVGAVPGAG